MFFPLGLKRSKLSLISYLTRLVDCCCFAQDRDWSTVKWINRCTMDEFHDFLFPCMDWYQGKGEPKLKGGAAM